MSSAKGTPRRTRVERGIYVRPDGKTYEIGWRDASGRQRYRVVNGGLRAARAALAEEIARRGRGERIAANPRLKFSEAAEQWWIQQASALRPRTQDAYRYALDRHLLPAWGRRRLDDIDVNSAALLIRDMAAKGYAAWTIRGSMVVAGRIFSFAQRRLGWCGQNPIRQLDNGERPKSDAKPRRILDGDELARLLDHADQPFARIFSFCAATGCRLGEVLGVVWGDLDLGEGTVHFSHQLDRRRQRVALKTARSWRTVELPGWLLSDLRTHRLASPFSADSDLVFSTAHGTPHDHRNVGGRALKRAIERAGIDTSTLSAPTMHSFRHGFASAFIAAGGDLVELSALLGHTDPSITASIYAHDFEKAARSDARRARIEGMYGQLGGQSQGA